MPYTISGSVNFTGGASNIINFGGTVIRSFVTTAPYDLIRANPTDGLLLERFTAVGATAGDVLTVISGANGQFNWTTPSTSTTINGVMASLNVNLAIANGASPGVNLSGWNVARTGHYNNCADWVVGTGVLTNTTANAKYDIWVQAEWEIGVVNASNNGMRTLEIVHNSTVIATKSAGPSGNENIPLVIEAKAAPIMAATDILYARVYQDSGASLNAIAVNTVMTIVRLQ